MNDNRRAFTRIPADSPIRYQRKGSQDFGNSVARDISEGGIGFMSNEFFPVSTCLIFEVRHPQTHNFIKAAGKVMWISKQPHCERYSVGARFMGPPLSV